jgi:hypothetical protein
MDVCSQDDKDGKIMEEPQSIKKHILIQKSDNGD